MKTLPSIRPSYAPLPWQQRLHASRAKVKTVQAARRAGKTRAALQEDLSVIDEISLTPVQMPSMGGKRLTADEAGLVPAIHVWTVAPTKAQMYQVWNEMQAFIPEHMVSRVNPYRDDYRQNGGRGSGFKEDDLRVWLVFKDEGGRWLSGRYRRVVLWELKSADNPDSLQSAGLDFLHVTEAQDIREQAWTKLAPMLQSPGRAGRALVEGIPPSTPAHWFARLFKAARERPNSRRESFKATYHDNPPLTEEQIAEILEHRETMLEEDWKRMYLAEQPEGEGAFFRNIRKVATASELIRPIDTRKYVGGLDIGRSNDSTVLVIKDRRTRESVHAVEMRNTDWNLQEQTVKATAERWGLERIVMDATGLGGQVAEDRLYQELAYKGIPVVAYNFTAQKKYQLYLDYAISLQQETVSFPASWSKLILQLEDMAHRETVNRGHHFFPQSGGHDDWVDAECLALYGCDPPSLNLESETGEHHFPTRAGIAPMGGRSGKRRYSRLVFAARDARHDDVLPPDWILNGIEIRN